MASSSNEPPADRLLARRIGGVLRAAGLGPDERVVVGFSGGVDSLVLLHLLSRLHARGRGPAPHALHVDHGLRPESRDDAARSRALAATLGVPCAVVAVTLDSGGDGAGVEATARAARYAALAEHARHLGTSWLAVAHNRDDQAETVLLRLLRGAGLDGLAAMRAVTRRSVPLISGEPVELTIVRPLLETPRAEIAAYAAAHALQPVEDPSNASPDFTRNRMRHELLPLAEALVMGAGGSIARAASLLAGDAALLAELAEAAAGEVLCEAGGALLVRREPLQRLPPALRGRVIQLALRRAGRVEPASFERTEALRLALERGRPATIELGGGLAARVDRSGARLGPREQLDELGRAASGLPLLPRGIALPLRAGLHRLDNGWQLELSAGPEWTVRTRWPGDRLCTGDGGTRRLQDWLVNRKVPLEARDRLALLVKADEVRWVAGVSGERFAAPDEGVEARVVRDTRIGEKETPLGQDS